MTDRKFPDNFHTAEFSQEVRDDMTDPKDPVVSTAVRVVGLHCLRCERFLPDSPIRTSDAHYTDGHPPDLCKSPLSPLILAHAEAGWLEGLADNITHSPRKVVLDCIDAKRVGETLRTHAKMLRELK